MTIDDFHAFIRRIEGTGLDRATAGRCAALIGDAPTMEGDTIVVREKDGSEIARLPFSVLGLSGIEE